MLQLETPVENLPHVGEKYVKRLEKLGIKSAGDLLFHFPFRYDDFSRTVPVGQEYVGQTITVEGTVKKSKLNRIFRRRMSVAEVVIQDGNNIPLKAVWFNQPYILDSLKMGTSVRLSGKLEFKGRTFSLSNPAWEKAGREATNTGILVPVYPETKGLTSRWIRWQLKMILGSLGNSKSQSEDPLPLEIRKRLGLPDILTALKQIHFPENREKLLRAQKRFAFEEMFLVQLKSLQVKLSWKKEEAVKIKFDEKLIKNFVAALPFRLTDAQRKAAFEILKDLEKPHPMNRLLNGDVGSGKTVVAAIAALQTITSGQQVAVMAPTEVLARQHFISFCKLFAKNNIKIGLVTSSYKEANYKPEAKKSSPESQSILYDSNIIIGTHALIQSSVRFSNLALLIVDEQHRFGVAQRAYLQQEVCNINDGIRNKIPHLLSMTATPIPRTLALAFFGNLDLSVLDEMPKNRKTIITKIVDPSHRELTYGFIRQEIEKGRQVFVILPLVEESKVLAEVKAAVAEHKRLAEKIFPDLKLGLLHGRLKSAEKEKVMREFSKRQLDILVSTSVIEVGIDIPNATVMIIEDADRFGLSQLHQFRGRVGRSEHQSYCFLFASSSGKIATERLKALEKNSDGFAIAEADLKQRGPGEFFGTRQSGLPDIAMENLANIKLIQISRLEAQNILKADPYLEKQPSLAEALRKFNARIHLE